MRFTPEEAAVLLRAAVGPGLSDAAVAALAARAEGWAAGLHLASLSLRGQADADRFAAAFSGSHRFVLDYLAEEVLEQQPEQVRAFLLETSVLDRLSGPLCDAVTGRADSQAMLEQVERANLFLIPLDEVRGWWRYHQLFADLLRARLQEERPGRVAALHRNAAAWSDQYGLADDAVRHALAAGDAAWAARLIERHADALLLLSEGATVRRWLAALPAELIESRPRLCLAQAFLAIADSDVAAIEPRLDAAERALAAAAGAADEPFEPSAGRAASQLSNVPAAIALGRASLAQLRGDAAGAITFGRRALAELGEGEWMLESITHGYLALAEWLNGGLAEAERALSSAMTQARAARAFTLAAWAGHHLGHVQRAQGRLDAAAGTYQLTLEITTATGQPGLPAAGIGYVGLAELAYQRGELDDTLRLVTEGIAACRQLPYTQPLATGLATLAWIRQANGDASGALDAMGEAERAAPAVTSLLNPVPAQRARLLLAQGYVAAAARWTQEHGLDAGDDPGYPREPEYLLLARVLLAQDRLRQALALLSRMHAAAVAQGRTGSIIEIQALQALALTASGAPADAQAALAGALTLGCPQGYVAIFADEGPPMRALLGQLVAARQAGQPALGTIPPGCLARLRQAFDRTHVRPRSGRGAGAPGLIEALTERELTVLELLAAGKSNPAIAGELVLTLDTVKKHVSHVLGKLGAANRTEAVTRARELDLIS